ncbi:hypothetical protein SAMN05192529_11251 [Arachidicoccus rhizosphaerae]|uniref:DUF2264 domain-containing protein n=1 Tax=Arachidicoccus rhizosphaerae TaxID=551991 RepID=A0A1H3ZUX4_9BACT|nr:DUF2264 domain-containing protein [Arachidicoccus rhizosphaerae]SEA27460.1 hypothetical protein SAMN05192529_11251 [Arachidicoccus rhizosphaerae]
MNQVVLWRYGVLNSFKRPYCLIAIILLSVASHVSFAAGNKDGAKERKYLVNSLVKIADPLLSALSQNQLVARMPVEAVENGREQYTYLEAFGRLLAGMAPWLALGPDASKEGRLREKYILLARKCLHNATDPAGADFMNFNKGGQPVVDAAFLVQALLRAPKQLWDPLDLTTKDNIIQALKSTRVITPGNNNWLLFSAIVEAGILKFTGTCQMAAINKAVDAHMKWYVGDGTYGDGPNYHWDYYNSYVIQPMFLEVLQELLAANVQTERFEKIYGEVLKRATRYAYIQESLISPEGTYPPLGRSLAYRFGAFQLLSQMALMQHLPADVAPQEVRAALYTVIKRQLSFKGTFDSKGWLQIGMVGHQRKIAQGYISTGSLYLCSEAFLILGLAPDNQLWQGPDQDWIGKKVWEGEDISIHHSI